MIAVVVRNKSSKNAVPVVGLEPMLYFGVAEHLEDVRSCDAEQDVHGSATFLTWIWEQASLKVGDVIGRGRKVNGIGILFHLT